MGTKAKFTFTYDVDTTLLQLIYKHRQEIYQRGSTCKGWSDILAEFNGVLNTSILQSRTLNNRFKALRKDINLRINSQVITKDRLNENERLLVYLNEFFSLKRGKVIEKEKKNGLLLVKDLDYVRSDSSTSGSVDQDAQTTNIPSATASDTPSLIGVGVGVGGGASEISPQSSISSKSSSVKGTAGLGSGSAQNNQLNLQMMGQLNAQLGQLGQAHGQMGSNQIGQYQLQTQNQTPLQYSQLSAREAHQNGSTPASSTPAASVSPHHGHSAAFPTPHVLSSHHRWKTTGLSDPKEDTPYRQTYEIYNESLNYSPHPSPNQLSQFLIHRQHPTQHHHEISGSHHQAGPQTSPGQNTHSHPNSSAQTPTINSQPNPQAQTVQDQMPDPMALEFKEVMPPVNHMISVLQQNQLQQNNELNEFKKEFYKFKVEVSSKLEQILQSLQAKDKKD
ncbi:hypothetical protein PSN45_000574 [Yamadazyma tenuis]|uniref:Myb/SANT-like domain-containing protein n=1 Tax=Candida tenuis (strain ATCC 10573 / BCRC 21748 / CBS 615 / JCM 9827 / NBRC 10315 / NRRL Y-1498 / VKM Y-70) TaxID=590646 RepID=G3B9G5_CANTC|nr:uncharacterized protein CANTEDRAFT_135810 [Yamadazyma tenuis ATCC 10573]EGV61882.1 hypothetical protein CANTEDRAFT_135810 [Yamadazyma tenuis ATCC 10573]WEJ93113.1 hypothetical protein PSN45_000574 [Yamadazyma tenuis]